MKSRLCSLDAYKLRFSVTLLEGSFRNISYSQRQRSSGAGKNWERWYEEFKNAKPHYLRDPSHVRWYPEELKDSSRTLEAKAYQRLFDGTRQEMDFQRACKLVDNLRLYHGIQLESWAYAGVLLQIGSLKDIPFMTHFWKQVKESVPSLGPNVYNAMAFSYAQNLDIEGAQYVIEELKAAGHQVTANSYNVLCSFDRPNLYFVEAIMETLQKFNIPPNIDTFTILMNTYTRELDFDSVIKTFNSITENNCSPNIDSYNALMHSRCVAELPNEARELLEYLLKDKPYDVVPNTSSYNILLQYYDSHGNADEAQEIFDLMKKQNVLRNTESYNCLIRSKYNAGNPIEALQTFEKSSFKKNEASYAAAIDAAVQGGQYDAAIKLLEQTRKRGFNYHERSSMPTYFEPLPSVYPRRCDYWEDCGDHRMNWDMAIQFKI